MFRSAYLSLTSNNFNRVEFCIDELFNFNLTFGLIPQVGGVKIVTVRNDPFSKFSGS